MQDTTYTVTCEIVAHDETMTLGELCRSAGVHAEWIMELVEQGALEPVAPREVRWRFSSLHLSRVHTARRLARDLDLNASSIALVLDLLDQIHELRARLNAQPLSGPQGTFHGF